MYEWMNTMFKDNIRPNHFVSRISAELLNSQTVNVIMYPNEQKPDLPYDFEGELDQLLTSHELSNLSVDGERVSVSLSPKKEQDTTDDTTA